MMKSKTEKGAAKILCLATRNQHKVEEFSSLRDWGWQLRTISNDDALPVIEETGDTFLANATLKAVGISNWVDEYVLADDSGLEVDALHGAPGVYSARYAEMNPNEKNRDELNNAKLLAELKKLGATTPESRRARFRCVLVLARRGKVLSSFDGICEGLIAESASGKNGFGYDPLFIPDGYVESFAALDPQIKLQISHRAKALEQMQKWLQECGKNL